MNESDFGIDKLELRVAYLEEVNLRIRASLETVSSLARLQEKMNVKSDPSTICEQSASHILRLVPLRAAAFFLFQENMLELSMLSAPSGNEECC